MDPWNPNPDNRTSAPPPPPPAPYQGGGQVPAPYQAGGQAPVPAAYPPGGQAPTSSPVPYGGAPIMAAPSEAPVYPVPIAPVKQQKKSSTALNVLLGLGLVVAVGGIAFAAGRLTAPASASTASGNGANGGFAGRFGNNPNASFPPGGGFAGRGAGAIALEGTVTAIDANGITIQTTAGQAVTIGTTSSTSYQTASSGSATDAAVGSTVLIQLDPTTGGFGGGGFGGGGFGNGNGGFGGGPNASAIPGASAAPNASVAPNASPRSFGDAKTVIVLPN